MKITLALRVALLFVVLAQAKEKCTPNKTKREDCNICFCTPTGVWICTKKGCLTKREASCKPGETFNVDECNVCHCSADGKPDVCTHTVCPKKRKRGIPSEARQLLKNVNTS